MMDIAGSGIVISNAAIIQLPEESVEVIPHTYSISL